MRPSVGHAAAEQATQSAQDGAVAAEHDADVGGVQGRLVDDRVAEGRRIVVPGGLLGRHEQLEAERLAQRGQLRQRRGRGRARHAGDGDDAVHALRHGRPPRRAPPPSAASTGGAGGGDAPVAEVDEVLHVPLWAGMTGIADAEHERRRAPASQAADAGQHIAMDAGVTHHAPLADSLATGLELRLHEHEAAVASAQGF